MSHANRIVDRCLRGLTVGVLALGVPLVIPAAGFAQQKPLPHLSLDGGYAVGARTTVTENFGTLEFAVTNRSDVDRRALVLVFYENRPDVQYGRDIWVPARAKVTSWLPIGPAPPQAAKMSRDIELLLHDVTDEKGQLILPVTEERTRPRPVRYLKRELTLAVVLDPDPDDVEPEGQLPAPETPGEQTLTMAQVLRAANSLTRAVTFRTPDQLPLWLKAYDGTDQIILASRSLGRYPAALRTLRHWLENGGRMWIMLDQVEPDTVAALLGEAFDFHIVGRLGLTDFQIVEYGGVPEAQSHERPVDFVRVVLPGKEPVPFALDGWPVWFTRRVGRGKVLLTTLGPRGWHRPRTRKDPPSPFNDVPDLPVAREMLADTANEIAVPRGEPAYPAEAFESLLTQEIGYTIVPRQTIVLVFGCFLIGAAGLSILARWWRRPEWLGWLGPIVALGAGGVLVIAGELSRRAAPPTVAFVEVVDAVNGVDEAAVQGLLAVYRPDSGAADFAAMEGGFFDLDMTGIEGQTRRMIVNDLDAWRWHNLSLPAGVRFAPFQFTAKTPEPIVAVARFGAKGLEGKLNAKPFDNFSDCVLRVTGKRRNLAVQLGPDGKFTANGDAPLPEGQFLAGAVLTDQQQRRQEILRQMLKRPNLEPRDARPVLYVWADAIPAPFRFATEPRVTGSALLAVPLRIERPADGERITIPGAFLQLHEVMDGRRIRPTSKLGHDADLLLRFQVPHEVLPIKIERARLSARIEARGRRVIIGGLVDNGFQEVYRADNPLGPIQVDIADERLLQLDTDGGIHMKLKIENPPQAQPASADWALDYFELEVVGRSAAEGARK